MIPTTPTTPKKIVDVARTTSVCLTSFMMFLLLLLDYGKSIEKAV